MPFLNALLTDTMRSLGLLTRLRVGARWFDGFAGRYDRAARAFPVAGVVVGLLVAAVGLASAAIGVPHAVAALLAVATGIVVTGALHEDGLADTADGLGGRDREARLAIMRDSATGAYGVLALGIVVGLKTAALAALLAQPLASLTGIVAACALARAGMVWLWRATPPAREDGAAVASGRPRRRSVRIAGAIAALAALPAAIVVGPWAATIALASLGAVAAGLKRYSRRLGGHTGDLLGACVLLGEVAVLVGLTVGLPAAGLAVVPIPPDMVSR